MLKRDTLEPGHDRSVRSFVARGGRLGSLHKHLLQTSWQKFGLNLQPEFFDFKHIFGRNVPVTLEIGFGDGRVLLNNAQHYPDQDFIGIEVYKLGIAKLLNGIEENQLTNVRIMCADAIEVLVRCIPDNSLHQLQLFFPDPWPKTRHHKRRIVQPEFIELVHKKLQMNGIIHMATDWQEYANYMLKIMQNSAGWENSAVNTFAQRPATRLLTKFEQRGQRQGLGSWDLIFYKRL